jgi:hypothetical protein
MILRRGATVFFLFDKARFCHVQLKLSFKILARPFQVLKRSEYFPKWEDEIMQLVIKYLIHPNRKNNETLNTRLGLVMKL